MSRASDASRVVARSSAFVSRLQRLEGKTIGVYSLLTSTRDFGSSPVRGDCSASRLKHNPPCAVAVDGLIDGFCSEGEVDEPGAGAEKGEERKVRKKVCQARCRETWMRWNGFQETHRLHSTENLKHPGPRAHEKNLRVCQVTHARGTVCHLHL